MRLNSALLDFILFHTVLSWEHENWCGCSQRPPTEVGGIKRMPKNFSACIISMFRFRRKPWISNRKFAMIREIAGTNAYIQMVCRDIFIIWLQYMIWGASPHEAAGKVVNKNYRCNSINICVLCTWFSDLKSDFIA